MEEKKKKGKTVVIVILSILLVCALAVSFYLAYDKYYLKTDANKYSKLKDKYKQSNDKIKELQKELKGDVDKNYITISVSNEPESESYHLYDVGYLTEVYSYKNDMFMNYTDEPQYYTHGINFMAEKDSEKMTERLQEYIKDFDSLDELKKDLKESDEKIITYKLDVKEKDILKVKSVHRIQATDVSYTIYFIYKNGKVYYSNPFDKNRAKLKQVTELSKYKVTDIEEICKKRGDYCEKGAYKITLQNGKTKEIMQE